VNDAAFPYLRRLTVLFNQYLANLSSNSANHAPLLEKVRLAAAPFRTGEAIPVDGSIDPNFSA